MKKPLLAIFLLLSLAANPNSRAQSPEPPFEHTLFTAYSFDNTMPTTLSEVAYIGQTPRAMFDWFYDDFCQNQLGKNAISVEFDAYVFQAAYTDSSTIEFLVNPEFGSMESAEKQVSFYAESIGRIPQFLRDGISVDMHAGDCGMGAIPGKFLIYTDYIKWHQSIYIYPSYINIPRWRGLSYENPNQATVEEILIHEGAHSALDQLINGDPEWQAAQQADGRFISSYARSFHNEDIAESFTAWMVLRYGKSILATNELAITEAIPNRISYFDKFFSETEWGIRFSPLSPPHLPEIDQNTIELSKSMLSRLADLRYFEGLPRVPRKDLSDLVATLMDWPAYDERFGHKDRISSDGILSHIDILIEALTELSYRNPSDEELAELPNFLMSDELYKTRLKTLTDLLNATVPEFLYTLDKGLKSPDFLILSSEQLNHIVTEALNFSQHIVGRGTYELWEEILSEVGIEYKHSYSNFDRFRMIGPRVILSRLFGIVDPPTRYPLPRFTSDGRIVIPFMNSEVLHLIDDVILQFPVSDAEIYNHQASLRDYIWSLYRPDVSTYRAELTLRNIENEIDFDVSQLIEIPHFWGNFSSNYISNYGARFSITKEVPQTLLLIIPVLETDIGKFYIELKYPELTLHHFRELE